MENVFSGNDDDFLRVHVLAFENGKAGLNSSRYHNLDG